MKAAAKPHTPASLLGGALAFSAACRQANPAPSAAAPPAAARPGDARVRAPLSGIVTKRAVDPGAFTPAATSGSVAQSAALLTVMDIRSVRIEIPVPEPEVPLVKVGLPVEVSLDEFPGHA